MELEKIIEYVKENGGITLNKELKKEELKKGFTISLQKYEYQTNLSDLQGIKENLQEKINILEKTNKKYYIGLWLDNNILYINLNKIELNKTRAFEFAKAQKQKALYDNKNQKCIYLKEYTFILYKYIEKIDDFMNIAEFSQKELINYLKIRDIVQLKHCIYNTIDCNINSFLKKNNNKYIIIKEEL